MSSQSTMIPTCSICQSNCAPHKMVVATCPAGHMFHKACLDQWSGLSGSVKCPVCKQPLGSPPYVASLQAQEIMKALHAPTEEDFEDFKADFKELEGREEKARQTFEAEALKELEQHWLVFDFVTNELAKDFEDREEFEERILPHYDEILSIVEEESRDDTETTLFAIKAFLKHHSVDDLDDFDDLYRGAYDDHQSFITDAYEHLDIPEQVMDELWDNIDWEGVWNDHYRSNYLCVTVEGSDLRYYFTW